MIIYKCDVCDQVTENDILPSDWSVIQATVVPQGMEMPGSMGIRHLCNGHTLDALLKAAKK